MDGVRIGVTSARRADELIAALERRGARVLHGPSLGGDAPVDAAGLVDVTRRVLAQQPGWLAASTGVGMRAWATVADEAGLGASLGAWARAATAVARGPKAVGGLAALDVAPAWVAPGQTDHEVVGWLAEHVPAGDHVVVQVHGGGVGAYDALVDAGVEVTEVLSYRWSMPDDHAPAHRLVAAIVEGGLDVVTFTSAGAVHQLVALAAELGADVPGRLATALRDTVAVAAVGPVTAEAVEQVGGTVDVVPERWRTGALLRSLDGWAAARR